MLNHVVIMGRLVADPELRHTSNSIPVTSFAVAVDRRAFSDKEKVADFLDIVAWRTTAEFVCKYFKKGSPIVIEGTLQSRTYQDQNNQKRKVVEIIAQNVSFTLNDNTRRDNSSASSYNSSDNTAYSSGSLSDFDDGADILGDDDDLPF